MADDDYYEILGVSKETSKADIKKAYKKLAKKYHPDNKESGDAERFKKINEAAAVLSDEKKKSQYDQFGKAGMNGFGGGGFDFNNFANFGDDFGDIFDHLGDIFGGSFGFGSRGGGRQRVVRGNDLRYDIDITLEEAAFGTTKSISFNRLDKCSECKGSGAEKGSGIETCYECNGRGQVIRRQRTPFGLFQTSSVCPKCKGEGKIIKHECKDCDGTGLVRIKKKLEVRIPTGIDDDMRLRIEGEGDGAPKQGINGDLYVFVHALPHQYFTRREDNIYLEFPISAPQAALGTEIEVPTLLGKAKLRIPAGTQPDTIFRMREKGVENIHNSNKGDQLVKVKVKIPGKLSRKEKELFTELEKESKKSGFFKNIFN